MKLTFNYIIIYYKNGILNSIFRNKEIIVKIKIFFSPELKIIKINEKVF